MALGQHVPRPSKGKTNTFKPQDNCGKPLLVVPREFQAGFESDKYEGARDVLIVDYVDLLANSIIPTVMTGSQGIRDDLKRYVPGGTENASADEQILAYKIEKRHNPKTGFDFYVVVPLEGPELQLAIAWEAKYGLAAVQAARAEYEAAAAVAAPNGTSQADTVAALQAQLAAALAAAQGGAAPAAATVPATSGLTQPAAPVTSAPAAQYSDEALATAIANLNAAKAS